jgi:enoyl-CoA hydratase
MAMVLFGEVISGEEAERIGLAYRCVDDDRLLDVAHAMAAKAAAGPRQLAQVVKRTIAEMADVSDHREAVAKELDPQVWSTRQPGFAERLAALSKQISSKR